MKICFFGLGSIGRRHLSNLRKIERSLKIDFIIHAFRSTEKILPGKIGDMLDKEIFRRDDLETYDVIFITCPTSLHYKTIKENIHITKHMFIEKPLFYISTQKITDIAFDNNFIYYVACPLRYSPIIKYLKSNLIEKNIYSIRCICSSYLPQWRLGIDYRKVYSAMKELGGGVSLDLIHELDYLAFLFGFPFKIINYRSKKSNLEIDCDDISIYMAEYDDKFVELHLDYFGRVFTRKIELYMKDDVVVGNFYNNTIEFLKSKKVIKLDNSTDYYIEELIYFINRVIKNKKTFNEIDFAYRVLALSEGKIL